MPRAQSATRALRWPWPKSQGPTIPEGCTTTAGKLELWGVAAQRRRAETGAGALTAGGNGEELSLSTVSGQLSLQVGQHPRQVKLNTVSGRIYAGLPEGEPGFTVEYSSMSGAFSSQFPLSGELGKRKGRAVYGLSLIHI